MENFGKQVILLILAALFGFFVSEYTYKLRSGIQHVDYLVNNTENVFNRYSSPTPQITVKTPDRELSEVTQVEIIFQNHNDSDFENIPVYIDFEPTNEGKIEIIGKSIVGERGLYEGIKEYKSYELDQVSNIVRVSFIINTFNRGAKWDDQPKATFLLNGSVAPKVEVMTNKKGVLIREYDEENYNKEEEILIWLLLAYSATVLLVLIFARGRTKSKFKKFWKEDALRKKQFIYSNKSSLIDPDETAIRKYASELMYSRSESLNDWRSKYEQFIKENADGLSSCSEEAAAEYAKSLIMMEHGHYKKNKSKFYKFISMLPEPDLDEL